MDIHLRIALIASSILSLFLSASAFSVATENRKVEDDTLLNQVIRLTNNVALLNELQQEREQRLNEMQGKPSIASSKADDDQASP